MSHWQKYGRSYLVGFLFFVVTNAQAVQAVFGNLTPAQLASVGHRQLAVLCFQVLALAGTNVLAFLNNTVATATNSTVQPQKQNP